jgi:hypothetical protein
MSDDELLALLEAEEGNCVSSTSGALAEQRRLAMQYYDGRPFGNEVEGRSQVVTTEVRDAVEGIMPVLMSIFASSEEIVRFEPQNPEDEGAAQQATDYINYVFSRNNNGFLTLYCLCKDALLQKNGYAKVYWEDYTDNGVETYQGLSQMEVSLLLQDPELELVEVVGEEGVEVYEKVVFRRTKKYGKVCIDPTPPEEVKISRDTPNDINKARFVQHDTMKTISDIRKMGYDIPDDIADDSSLEFDAERVERNIFDDSSPISNNTGHNDPSTRTVCLKESYLWVDFDKDGIAEYRKVTRVGKTILDNVEFDSLPIIGGTAILMPHKHYGRSVYDLLGEIQLIKSTITRALLDNAYVANNGRMVVLDGMVNMEDLLTVRPNGIIRAKAMNAVQRLDNPLLGAPFYNLLDYFDKVKTNRIGARDFGDAIDPNALNAKAHTAELVRNAAQERINLMARILAEGPIKALFWKILELVCKHQQKPQMVKLRGTWVQIDPREWKNKFNLTVTVGLGTGSAQAVIQSVNAMAGIMMGLVQAGYGRLVSEHNAYQLGHIAEKALFPKESGMLITNPAQLPPPQPAPNPEMIELQLKSQKMAMQDAQKKMKLEFDAAMDQRDKAFQAQAEQFKAMVQSALKDKDHRAALQQTAVDAASDNQARVVDAITTLKVAEKQAEERHSEIVLQGVIDSMAQMQKEAHERHQQSVEVMTKLTEAAMAEKEIVRDEKGKAKGVRAKAK